MSKARMPGTQIEKYFQYQGLMDSSFLQAIRVLNSHGAVQLGFSLVHTILSSFSFLENFNVTLYLYLSKSQSFHSLTHAVLREVPHFCLSQKSLICMLQFGPAHIQTKCAPSGQTLRIAWATAIFPIYKIFLFLFFRNELFFLEHIFK